MAAIQSGRLHELIPFAGQSAGAIREIQPAGSGRYSLLLKNGTRLDMTCSLGELQARLGEV